MLLLKDFARGLRASLCSTGSLASAARCDNSRGGGGGGGGVDAHCGRVRQRSPRAPAGVDAEYMAVRFRDYGPISI